MAIDMLDHMHVCVRENALRIYQIFAAMEKMANGLGRQYGARQKMILGFLIHI